MMDEYKYSKRMKMKVDHEMPLKLYLFLVRPMDDSTRKLFFERVEICMGYQLESAFSLMEEIYKDESPHLFIRNIGIINADEILDAIEPKGIDQTLQFKVIEEDSKDDYDPKMSYLCSLKYTSDAFTDILSKADKDALKRIVKKIDKHLAYDAKQDTKKRSSI